jgi:hypothetical protein
MTRGNVRLLPPDVSIIERLRDGVVKILSRIIYEKTLYNPNFFLNSLSISEAAFLLRPLPSA